MRPGNGVSPHVKEQFIWNELSLRSSSRRETCTLVRQRSANPCDRECITRCSGVIVSNTALLYRIHIGHKMMSKSKFQRGRDELTID